VWLAAVIVLKAVAWADEPPTVPPEVGATSGEEVEVTVVNVDVSVRDRGMARPVGIDESTGSLLQASARTVASTKAPRHQEKHRGFSS
jgi:hypothetical protein